MSDVASASVEVIAVKSVRRGRSRVRVAQEVGADLLRVSAHISEEEARVLAQARGILLKLPWIKSCLTGQRPSDLARVLKVDVSWGQI